MATNLLSDTINYITPFCRYMDANIGLSGMPIVGIASIVRNIMLAAPFQWRFNRGTNSLITTQAGVQDYTLLIPDFGFLETATLTDPDTGTIYDIKDIKNNMPLSPSTTKARPSAISVENDDGSNGILFRFSAVPERAYAVNLTYQKAAVQFSVIADRWNPIPDSFSDVYNNLVMGYYMDSCQDSRAQMYIARGIAGLLARSSGLSQMDKALFAASYMNFGMQQMLEQLKTQQSVQAQASR